MWQQYLQLRQQYLEQPKTGTQIHQNYVRNLFLYELSALSGFVIPQQDFEHMISSSKPQHTSPARKVYDLWQAWKYKSKDMNHTPEEFEEFIVQQQIKFFEQEID